MHYITFLLIETSFLGKKFESVFLFGSSFTLLTFLWICKLQRNVLFYAFFLYFFYAIIIFCLIYCLNILYSNQNPSFFPVERLIAISSKFTFHHLVVIYMQRLAWDFNQRPVNLSEKLEMKLDVSCRRNK